MNIKLKKITFICLSTILILSICEGMSYLIWKHYLNMRLTYRYYSEIMKSANNYEFNKNLRMITPIAGTTIVYVTEEYVDKYQINKIDGFGVFDSGINPDKKIVILALGDSFTRGQGSLDNLRYGWVAIVKNKLKNIDIVNLSYLGSGQIQEVQCYNKIKNKIKHDMVMLNIFGQSDFYDNIKKYYESSDFIDDLPSTVDKDIYLRKLLRATNYRISLEYITRSPIKSYTIWLLLKVYEKFVSRFPPISSLSKIYNEHIQAVQEQNERIIPVDIKKLWPDKWTYEKSQDGSSIFYYDQRFYRVVDQAIAQRIAKYSADIINSFYRNLKDEKKYFLLIFHPSKEEIYLYNQKDSSYDFDFMRKKFESYLDKDIPILDLVPSMRNMAHKINDPFFYRADGHYTQAGYKAVAELIYEYLVLNNFDKIKRRN